MKFVYVVSIIQYFNKLRCSEKEIHESDSNIKEKFYGPTYTEFRESFEKRFNEIVRKYIETQDFYKKLKKTNDATFHELKSCIEAEKERIFIILCCLDHFRKYDKDGYYTFSSGIEKIYVGFRGFIDKSKDHYNYLAYTLLLENSQNYNMFLNSPRVKIQKDLFESCWVEVAKKNYIYKNVNVQHFFKEKMAETFCGNSEIFGSSLLANSKNEFIGYIIDIKIQFLCLLYLSIHD
ncbi:hypothetical protein EDEG_01626 [Edhazardia aedis USNM 41457]|uniref:Uncharacterized protein n=1 Tax=Edhazardia aedis (strain USNM 41457) TaxID=1003232 RepID=J9D9E2_EDHAE|nr:hypothetical protein EDEG_01626 [Edhazardia aedis USNM 41457]|eukprot:EJW04104.1 hypothetical protein EDEG_01626 [Edhazardia aedis USNM 41457]